MNVEETALWSVSGEINESREWFRGIYNCSEGKDCPVTGVLGQVRMICNVWEVQR